MRRGRKIELAGRTVLITGGSRGLGLALAREFAHHGARIALCARDTEELDAAKRDIGRLGVDVATFVCDLREPAGIRRVIDDVELSFGPIEVLVNNAGTILVGPAQVMGLADYEEAMNVNFWAAVHATSALAPKMAGRGGGRIVNIGSVGGKMPVPHLAPYCASKFALAGFSGALRSELGPDGILVTSVSPGLMRTGSPRNAKFKGDPTAEYAWFSIGDSLPGVSISAEAAARSIVDATVFGDAEVVLGLPAQLAALSYGLAPNLHVEISSLINRLLPSAKGATGETRFGHESESWVTRSFLRYLGRKARESTTNCPLLDPTSRPRSGSLQRIEAGRP